LTTLRQEPENTSRRQRKDQQLLALEAKLEATQFRLGFALGALQTLADWKSCDINDMKNEARFAIKVLNK
jgi:hypothetical protein